MIYNGEVEQFIKKIILDHMDNTTGAATCMACSCPCEAHTVHNHAVEEKNAVAACAMCGHEHTADNACHCGCK